MHTAQVTNMVIGKTEHFLTSDQFGNDFYMLNCSSVSSTLPNFALSCKILKTSNLIKSKITILSYLPKSVALFCQLHQAFVYGSSDGIFLFMWWRVRILVLIVWNVRLLEEIKFTFIKEPGVIVPKSSKNISKILYQN